MPCYGGACPAPRRMGGGKPRVKLFVDALAAARGTSVAASDSRTTVYVETLAVARALAAAWATNQRLANQWDARRMTTMLPRWEAILGISPSATDDDVTRRKRIQMAQSRVGRASLLTAIQADLSNALGAVFVGVEFISVANANVTAPDGTYPWGVVLPGAPWSSTVAHVLVRTQKPAGYQESDFLAAVGLIAPIMENIAPAWITYDWYRPGTTSVNVAGGPSAGGFYLDDSFNLGYEVFDV